MIPSLRFAIESAESRDDPERTVPFRSGFRRSTPHSPAGWRAGPCTSSCAPIPPMRLRSHSSPSRQEGSWPGNPDPCYGRIAEWISSPPGLARYGCPPHRLLLARCRNASETLWTLEEGLRGSGLAAAAGSVEAPEFTETRRLQIAARREGRALLLLRPFRNPLPASAAATRWLASSRPSAGGAPRWRLELLRHRGGAPREWTVDFHGDPCRLRLAGTADAIAQTA